MYISPFLRYCHRFFWGLKRGQSVKIIIHNFPKSYILFFCFSQILLFSCCMVLLALLLSFRTGEYFPLTFILPLSYQLGWLAGWLADWLPVCLPAFLQKYHFCYHFHKKEKKRNLFLLFLPNIWEEKGTSKLCKNNFS